MKNPNTKEVIEQISKVGNFEDLTTQKLSEFSKAILLINEFQKNVSNYAEKIFINKFIGNPDHWKQILNEKDYKILEKKLNNRTDRALFVFDYVNKKFTQFSDNSWGWIMGWIGQQKHKYTINENNLLVVNSSWLTQSSRSDHIPEILRTREIIINYVTGEIISIEGDDPNDCN